MVTMLPKVVVLLASLYVVKAGVLTVNAFAGEYDEIDQGPEEVVVRTTRSCGAAECNAFCRKLGYARGVCIGTYCQCRSRAAKDVFQPEIENPSDDSRSAILDAIRPEIDIGIDDADSVDRSVRNCVNSQCNSICRALGFARGVCVSSSVCRCSGRRVNSVEKTGTSDDIYQEIARVDGDADSVDRSVRNCVNSQCNNICRALGFARGVCVSSSVCRCSGRRVNSVEKTGTSDDIYQEIASVNDDADSVDRSVRNCVNSQCNSICRALGFARGVCVSSSVCRCSGRRVDSIEKTGTSDDIYKEIASVNDDADSVDRSVRNCVNSQCNSICRALGFARGVCVSSSVCRCSGRRVNSVEKTGTSDDIYQEIASVNDDADSVDRSVRNCVNSQCNNICRALGFARGVCVSSSVCRCSGRLFSDASLEPNTIEDKTPELNEVADKKENCNLRWCEQTCRRMGFSGGACVNGRCKCDSMLSSPTTDSDIAGTTNETDPETVKPTVEEESNDIPEN